MSSNARVLIVDDEMFMRQILRDILQRASFEVVGEATNGEEAVQQYRQLQPDVVLMDIIMPRMDGIEATRQILSLDPQARVVMCTALGQEGILKKALQLGARDFLVKPFRPEKIIEALHKSLSEKQ